MKARADRRGLEPEAEPEEGRRRGWGLAFALAGGPLAWFVQLDADYALFSTPCFPGPERRTALAEGSTWVVPAGILVYLLCLAVAVASAIVASRIHRRASAEDPEGRTSRDCFLGLCGIMLGAGFALTIFLSGLALLMVPACAL